MRAPDARPGADLPLFVWLSPAFPVGGFAYSHGLESAVDAGLVVGAATLGEWIADLLAHGSIRQDAFLLAGAWRAAADGDGTALAEVNDLALALCASRERRGETATMGNAFMATLRATWPEAVAPGFGSGPASGPGGDVAYPVAVGAASATRGIALGRTATLFALGFVANLVSAALRLGAIGQTDGQRVTLATLPTAEALGVAAEASTLDDIGACAFRSDLAALAHETQYSRLFRS